MKLWVGPDNKTSRRKCEPEIDLRVRRKIYGCPRISLPNPQEILLCDCKQLRFPEETVPCGMAKYHLPRFAEGQPRKQYGFPQETETCSKTKCEFTRITEV